MSGLLSVRASDFVLRHVGKSDARDLLMPLRQNVLVAVHEEVKRFDERVGLSCAGTGFDEEALLALQAAIHFGEPLFGWPPRPDSTVPQPQPS